MYFSVLYFFTLISVQSQTQQTGSSELEVYSGGWGVLPYSADVNSLNPSLICHSELISEWSLTPYVVLGGLRRGVPKLQVKGHSDVQMFYFGNVMILEQWYGFTGPQ